MTGYGKRKYCNLFLTLLLLFYAQALFPQSRTVFGIALNRSSGDGVPYVTVSLPGIGGVTTSDLSGFFSLELPANASGQIEVTSVGYRPTVFALPENYSGDTIRIMMEESFINANDVVVTATRNTRLISEMPVLTRTISRDEINRASTTSVTDIISRYTSFADFYNEGRGMTFRTQGLSTKYTLFLIDGERVAGENRDNIDYYRLNSAIVERIEIIPGASSSLYGSNAMGSVINLITRCPRNPLELSGGTRFSNYNEFEHSLSAGGDIGPVNYFVNGLRRSAAGYDNTPLSSPDLWTVEPFEVYSGFGRIDYKLSQSLELGARLSLFSRERFNAVPHQPLHPLYTSIATGINADWKLTGRTKLTASLYRDNYSSYDILERLNDARIKRYNNTQTTGRMMMFHQSRELFSTDHAITAGAEFFNDIVFAERIEDSLKTNRIVSFFLQDEVGIGERLSMVAGIRADLNSEYGNALSPKVSVMYRAGDINLRSSWAKGFRAPGIKERYYDFDLSFVKVIGNKDLVPEVSSYFSLSAEYLASTGTYTINLYRNRIHNMIHEIKIEELFNGYTYENFLNVLVSGADLNVRSRVTHSLFLTASYSYTDVLDEETGAQLVGVSRHASTFMLDYLHRWRGATAGVALSARLSGGKEFVNIDYYTGEMFDDYYPAYSIWRLSGSLNLMSNSLILNAGIDNLLNYQALSDVICNDAGRRLFLSLNVSFDRLYNHLKLRTYEKR